MSHSERGSVSVLVMAVVVLAGVFAVQVARLGVAARDRARADAAADAAALAAVGELARGGDPDRATASARATAASNGGRLQRCDCDGPDAAVEVIVGTARGRARAEMDASCLVPFVPCARDRGP